MVSNGKVMSDFNPYPAKSLHLKFHSLEVVSPYRDSQPQVVEKYHICLIWDQLFPNLDA